MYRDFSCSNASSKMYLELNIIVNHSVPFTSDGIATRYGLNGPGIESRWGGEIFRTGPYRPWGPQWVSALFPSGKATGA